MILAPVQKCPKPDAHPRHCRARPRYRGTPQERPWTPPITAR
ncbi:hypothetical protein BIWAKO_05341 [Bosea sp. BIWAKO-01]|nr:hypothetical protein BIWAKO_05341 [Bosea sp. BIWAKO-01]